LLAIAAAAAAAAAVDDGYAMSVYIG